MDKAEEVTTKGIRVTGTEHSQTRVGYDHLCNVEKATWKVRGLSADGAPILWSVTNMESGFLIELWGAIPPPTNAPIHFCPWCGDKLLTTINS